MRELDRIYKTRWPCNENAIKALVAVGFDKNLDRGLTLTSSRGTDGRLARLQVREQVLHDKIEAFAPTTVPQAIRDAGHFFRDKTRCAEQRAELAAIPKYKGARMPTGAEWLCKNLMLLLYNALALLLMRSHIGRTRRPAGRSSRIWRTRDGRQAAWKADRYFNPAIGQGSRWKAFAFPIPSVIVAIDSSALCAANAARRCSSHASLRAFSSGVKLDAVAAVMVCLLLLVGDALAHHATEGQERTRDENAAG